MNVNLDKFFDEQKPTITVFGKTYEVNNDYKKVIGMQKFGESVDQGSEDGGIRAALEYALVDGKNAADEILSHRFSYEFYQKLSIAIQAAMSGKSMDEIEKAAAEAMSGGRFPGGKEKRV